MQVLPEKEARVIISQIFQGLAYLNNASRADGGRIIHYDLKPGNILFDSLGQVKITVSLHTVCVCSSDDAIKTSTNSPKICHHAEKNVG